MRTGRAGQRDRDRVWGQSEKGRKEKTAMLGCEEISNIFCGWNWIEDYNISNAKEGSGRYKLFYKLAAAVVLFLIFEEETFFVFVKRVSERYRPAVRHCDNYITRNSSSYSTYPYKRRGFHQFSIIYGRTSQVNNFLLFHFQRWDVSE